MESNHPSGGCPALPVLKTRVPSAVEFVGVRVPLQD